MLATIFLLVLMAVVVWTDVTRHRIYNWTTYPGILAAWALNSLGDLLAWGGFVSAERLQKLGWIALGPSLFGFLLCGGLMLACFVFFRIGGGDVKLMAMIGAFLGPQEGLEALLWTFVLGGCLGLILLIWRVGAWRLMVRVFRQIVWSMRIFHWSPLSEEEHAQLHAPLFLAPSAFVAVIIVCIFARYGLVEWLR
jgi:prepilin peptidase CpaA